jgi:hypothetical protein
MQQQQYGRINFKALKDRANGSMPLVLKHYGIDVVGTGEQVHILCPFHDDERPSNRGSSLHQSHTPCSRGAVAPSDARVSSVWVPFRSSVGCAGQTRRPSTAREGRSCP